jgi:KDO2-lipid IV(A) lauroyltransferase
MARPSSVLVEWLQYLGVRAATSLMHCFDVESNLRTAGVLGAAFYRISRRHRERAIRSISLGFPEWSPARVVEVAERSMRNMFQLLVVDSVIMPRLLSEAAWPGHVRFGDLRRVVERMIRRQPIVFVTGHCGNWELLGYSMAVMGFPMHALARPLDNRFLNRWLLGVREAKGMKIITKWGSTPMLQDTIKHGGRLGFIADQNAGDQGLFVPFFGRLASSWKSVGLMAMRYKVPVAVGAALRTKGRFHYDIDCWDYIDPSDWAGEEDPLFYITARINRAIETIIRAAPEQYLWVHRRWKSRPRHERLGQPMPARLIAKLRALPWMTDSELDLVVDRSNESARRHATGEPMGTYSD